MMTEKVYYQDGYLKKIEAEVRKLDGNRLYLDRTIFYPEGGGPPGDKGTFRNLEIIDTLKDGDDVVHILRHPCDLKAGDRGELCLSWDYRYHYMQMHTAQHLVSSLFYTLFSLHTVAVHLGEEYLTVELKEDDVTEEELEKLELEANGHILSSLRVYSRDMDRKDASDLHMRRSIKVDGDEVKVVVIENTDEVPCGGVHVRNTRELRHISYLRKEHIRGHVRTYWRVGEYDEMRCIMERRVLSEISSLLSSKTDSVIADLNLKLGEIDSLKSSLRTIEEKGAIMEAGIVSSVFHECTFHSDEVGKVLKKSNGGPFFLTDKGKESFTFVGKEEEFSALRSAFNLKGGGRDGIYRGKVSGALDRKALEEVLLGKK